MNLREDVQAYMNDLRAWLKSQQDAPLEAMSDFFTARLDGYEAHMAHWREDYRRFASLFPENARDVLDLGCGTGLELDELLLLRPDLRATGLDLCPAMLEQLKAKHPDVRTVCGDYFTADLGQDCWDAVISFESLHHFSPAKKADLYRRVRESLRPGGVFMLCDYMACCDEEEALLRDTCREKRLKEGIPEEQFVHFDTPLTVPHELELLRGAGFADCREADGMKDAVLLVGRAAGQAG